MTENNNCIKSQSFINRLFSIIESTNFTKFVQNNDDLLIIFEGVFLSLFTFLIYIEYSPGMGGILFRPWSDGKTHFNPLGALPMLKYPFEKKDFWRPELWDLNFIVFTVFGTLIYYIFRKYMGLLIELEEINS